MGNDPKQGEDFVKVPLPREADDVEGHKAGIDPKQGEDFVKVPLPRKRTTSRATRRELIRSRARTSSSARPGGSRHKARYEKRAIIWPASSCLVRRRG